MTSHPVLWKPLRPLLEQRIHLNNWTRDAHVPALPACLEKASEKQLSAWSQECLEGKIKNNFSEPEKFFWIWIWKVLPLQWRFGQLEKAPETLSARSQECLEGKIKKQLFGARKVVFLIGNWEVLPLQWRFGQLEKAPETLSAWSQECLEGKIKKQLFGARKVFLNLHLEGSPFAMALWAAGKSTWNAQCLVPRVSGRENKKTTFRSPKRCFFNWQLGGSPFAMALWAAGKSTWKAQCLVPRVSGRENKKTTFRSPKKCFFNLQLEGSPFAMALWAAGKAPAICPRLCSPS